jgi:DNA mismatch endonuclease (patch repair protein)
MAEKISPEVRSRMMSSVRGKNTLPEKRVRSILHSMGLRFVLHRKDLPGRPDIVLPRHRLAIFVHGCFWHRHSGCFYTTTPKNNAARWEKKFAENVRRDALALEALRNLGWRTIVVWECALKIDPYLRSLPQTLGRAVTSNRMKRQIPGTASARRPSGKPRQVGAPESI